MIRARTILGRSWLVVADQSVSSLSNFLLVLLVGRWLGPEALGVFSLAFATWLVALGLVRALITDPMLVLGEDHRNGAGGWMAAALSLSTVLGFSLVAVALWLGPEQQLGRTLLVMGLFLPALLVQDFWRWVGFMRQKAGYSLLNDLMFLTVQLLALFFLASNDRLSAPLAVACWGVGALAGGFTGMLQFSTRPVLDSAVPSLRRGSRMGKWIALYFVSDHGSRLVYVFIVATIAGTTALGGLQASINLTGPANVLFFGAVSAALADAGRAVRVSGYDEAKRITRIYGVGLIAAVSTYCLVYVLFAPWILPTVYGESYRPYIALALPVALFTVSTAFVLVPAVRLKVLQQTRLMGLARMVVAPISLVMGLGLTLAFGLHGAAWGGVVVFGAPGGALWLALRQAENESLPIGPEVVADRPEAALGLG